MKRYLWLALVAIPVLALGVVGDVAAGQVEGVNGEGGRPFTTVLMGANEVPAATGSDLVGTARVTINLGQSELCWDLDYTTTQHVVAAHIHKGPAGVAAPVVFGFFNPPRRQWSSTAAAGRAPMHFSRPSHRIQEVST